MNMCNTKVNLKSRREIVFDSADDYKLATKKRKGEILAYLIRVTKYNRKYLMSVLKDATDPNVEEEVMKRVIRRSFIKKRKYSDNAIDCLASIWKNSGKINCKSLKVMLPEYIRNAEKFGWLKDDNLVIDTKTKRELKNISQATIGRYLVDIKKSLGIKGISTTKPGTMLRNSIEVRRAGDEVEKIPGFIEIDTVAHCGNTLKGEFVRSITATDAFIGWTENAAIRNNAFANIESGLIAIESNFPYKLLGFDVDNGSEFINHDMVRLVNQRDLYFTRSRPYMKNDNARVEQKNNVTVRKVAHYNRYNTLEEIAVMNELYSYLRLRFNFLTPTRKVYYVIDQDGKKKRKYDEPKTPYQRLLDTGTLNATQSKKLQKQYAELNLAHLTKKITELMEKLDELASWKPESQDYGNNHKKQSVRRKGQKVL
jgi:hypothetical protein